MSNWVKLNPSEFNKSEHVVMHGADVEVFLSPYDMPEAIRGAFAKDAGKFLIEFKYIGGDEPLEEQQEKGEKGSMLLQIGRHSKRLYQILLDLDPNKSEVTLNLLLPKVSRQLETLAKLLGSEVPVRNYEVTKEILAKKGKQLLHDIHAA